MWCVEFLITVIHWWAMSKPIEYIYDEHALKNIFSLYLSEVTKTNYLIIKYSCLLALLRVWFGTNRHDLSWVYSDTTLSRVATEIP